MLRCERIGHLGCITLNRPEALNALNQEMITGIHEALDEWELDDAIEMILIRSCRDDLFCAGGDVKALYAAKDRNIEHLVTFFKSEYQMNYRLKTYAKPIMSLMNGLCMGGGVGLGMHVAYPIIAPDFVFAMPETLIGLFPDVGSSFILNQLPASWKNYVGIFGGRLQGSDLEAFHLVEGVIPTQQWPQLIDELSASKKPELSIESHIKRRQEVCVKAPHPEFYRFEADDFRNLMENLSLDQGAFFADIHQKQASFSPLSMYVTFMQLHLTHGLGFKACLELDYRLIQHFLKESDFFEGVRALLVDKDKKPKWLYEDWKEVPNELVKRFFYQDIIADKQLF